MELRDGSRTIFSSLHRYSALQHRWKSGYFFFFSFSLFFTFFFLPANCSFMSLSFICRFPPFFFFASGNEWSLFILFFLRVLLSRVRSRLLRQLIIVLCCCFFCLSEFFFYAGVNFPSLVFFYSFVHCNFFLIVYGWTCCFHFLVCFSLIFSFSLWPFIYFPFVVMVICFAHSVRTFSCIAFSSSLS